MNLQMYFCIFFLYLSLQRLFKGMMVSYLTALGGTKENVISALLERCIV